MFSQTTEYALRAMSCLAYAPDELLSTTQLATQTKVPSNYLAKVLQSLANTGLIEGRRGVGGGYRLARKPSEITLLEVINTATPVERIRSCPLGIKGHGSSLCSLHRRLDRGAKMLIDLYDGITLEDIVRGRDEPLRPLCDTGERVPSGMTYNGAEITNCQTNGHTNGHASADAKHPGCNGGCAGAPAADNDAASSN